MKKEQVIQEVVAISLLAIAVLFFLSLVSYDALDLPWFTSNPNSPVRNLIKHFGAYLAGSVRFVLGWGAYFIPFIFVIFSLQWFGRMRISFNLYRIIGLAIAFLSYSSFFALFMAGDSAVRFYRGGIIGMVFSDFLINYLGRVGAYVFVVGLGLLSLPLVAEISVVPLFSLIKNLVMGLAKIRMPKVSLPRINIPSPVHKPILPVKKNNNLRDERKMGNRNNKQEAGNSVSAVRQDIKKETPPELIKAEKPKIKIFDSLDKQKQQEAVIPKAPLKEIDDENYNLPSLGLLDAPPPLSVRQIKDDLQANARNLEDTLLDFGISVRVSNVERGPVITRYELAPAPGVKVQKIVALSDDISLAMKASSVRIVAPIPGKAAVGVEVPNSHSSMVFLQDVLTCPDFQNNKSKLTLALGKDISGQPVIADLGEMPHLLIAGTTGSGKTVCVNSIIMSMLFNSTPSDLKFLMIDPKMVELAPYNGLPHLLCPVVTEHKKVSSALNWVVNEMDERYRLFAKEGTRNIEYYNKKKQKLPYIVVIIDELADLMAVAQNQIENAITRLAQLSRAVGIHLILATQRPSVDVITGVIKANFPARISFKVASKVDSRTVLDMNGADKLLGKGDMLFLKPGEAKLIRAQGSYIQDLEIERVIDFIKKQAEPIYDEEILREQEKSALIGDFKKDELFGTAVKMILESQHASVSILQRRLRLGYTRAARLIDMMEEEGIVGPFRGSKPREILVDKDSYISKEEENINAER